MKNITDFQNYEDLTKPELINIIEQQKEQIKNITYIAYTDLLTTNYLKSNGFDTRIYNRTYWEEVYKEENKDIECDLYLIDVNNLKNINDSFGHLAGDDSICASTEIICKFGFVARLGGDEFVLIVTKGKEQECAEFFKQNLNTLPFAYGIAKKSSTDTFFDATKIADDDMYKTKSKMKNNKK